jgi:hypothetical protein
VADSLAPLGTSDPPTEADAAARVTADYVSRGAEFAAVERVLRDQADRLSHLRLAAFAMAAVSGIMVGTGRGPAALTLIGLIVGGVGFVAAARRHGVVRRRAGWASARRVVCEQGRLRVDRDWTAIVSPLNDPPPRDHPYAADLDVTGHASLARLLDVTSAGPGRSTLLSWLMNPPPPVRELRDRQLAVREMAPADEWRETLTARAWTIGSTRRSDVDRFLTWAEGEPWLMTRPAVLWAARILPFLIVPALVLAVLGVVWSRQVSPPTGSIAQLANELRQGWWALPLIAGVALWSLTRRFVAPGINAALSHLGGLDAYAEMLAHVETSTFTAARFAELRARLATGAGASRELARLRTIVRVAETRYSPMAHAVLQLLVLWDFHALAALERWQRASGAHARDWLAALGEAEALSALATLAHDNPRWAMPELIEHGDARIDARSLGHPLLPAHTRVSNDITVGPPGTFVLVTGSNMSGKSTLLRAIGTNLVLAQAGGPVCAAELRLTPVDLWTSIRIDDSLEAGVSLFMAELRRLKRIVDAARDTTRARPLLYLLDEILHGTNTAERRIAARRVINHLVKAGAVGAVTTHDLTLAEDPSLDAAAQRVHFTERFEVHDGVTSMTFDYRLRPGLATSANALKLLAMIGLGDDPARDLA